MAQRVKDSIDVSAPPEKVFEVATDFSSYPEWNSNIKRVEVNETDDDGRAKKVWFEVDARVRVVRYTLDYDYSNAPRSFSWDLVDGDVKELSGSYSFDGAGERTTVSYELQIDPGFPIPSFLRRQAERQIVKGALDDLKRRVESR